MSSQGYFHPIGIEGSRFQGHHSLGTGTHHLEREPSTLGNRNTGDSSRFSSTLFFSFCLFVCFLVSIICLELLSLHYLLRLHN